MGRRRRTGQCGRREGYRLRACEQSRSDHHFGGTRLTGEQFYVDPVGRTQVRRPLLEPRRVVAPIRPGRGRGTQSDEWRRDRKVHVALIGGRPIRPRRADPRLGRQSVRHLPTIDPTRAGRVLDGIDGRPRCAAVRAQLEARVGGGAEIVRPLDLLRRAGRPVQRRVRRRHAHERAAADDAEVAVRRVGRHVVRDVARRHPDASLGRRRSGRRPRAAAPAGRNVGANRRRAVAGAAVGREIHVEPGDTRARIRRRPLDDRGRRGVDLLQAVGRGHQNRRRRRVDDADRDRVRSRSGVAV